MADSIKRRSTAKRDKFPLTLHKPSGQYRKRIRGRDYYFGKDADVAVAEWLRVKDDLLAGRTPRPFEGDTCDLKTLCNVFLTNAKAKRDSGEISNRSFTDYYKTCERMLKHLGKSTSVESMRPDELMKLRRALAETLNANSLGNEIGRVRVVLRFAFENGLTDKPIRFGDFKRPHKRVIRREKNEAVTKLFEPTEINQLLGAAEVQMRAMILLGINCGFGPSDCGQLPAAAIDLDAGWINHPRPKTGIGRRCPLWRETVDALRAALEVRKSDSDTLVFRRKCGKSWFVDSSFTPIAGAFRKLGNQTGTHQTGRGFYALRHCFQTIGDQRGDYLSTKTIMGHADHSISATYREGIDDARLVAVVDHVRTWLFE